MSKKNTALIAVALAALVGTGVAAAADKMMDDSGKVKCYGVAKAGKNACASTTGTHSCKGQAKVDGDKGDFVLAKNEADCNNMHDMHDKMMDKTMNDSMKK